MPQPTAVAVALAVDGRFRYVIAAEAQINASMLSGIASGRVVPSPAVRDRLAEVLGRDAADLWPDLPTAEWLEASCKASNVPTTIADPVTHRRVTAALRGSTDGT